MRRNFTRNQREQIVMRATDATGVVRCERCGLALKPGDREVDHVLAEALRPEADKQKRITIAEGQLLGKCCHRGADGKTNADVKKIAKGKRQNAKHLGIRTTPVQKIPAGPKIVSERTAAKITRGPKIMPPRRALYELWPASSNPNIGDAE